jgi:SAM-dependent methyltransferase
MRSLVEATELRLGSLHQKHVLDIGCNDGSLLAEFRQRGAKTIGIEPTAAGAEARQRGHAVTEAYLSPEVAEEVTRVHGRPDVITFTNVFAHIDSLAEVLHSLRIMMADQTVVVIENHYLGAIIDQCQFDTFYHEHPRTYSLTSFKHIANSLGRAILDVEFPKRYGGNIRVFIGAQARKDGVSQVGFIQRALASEANFGERLRAMPAQVARWKVRAKGRIDELLSSGPLVGKAFPGRAAILVKLLGLDIGNMNAVYEKPESPKIGNRLPGTQIPILSDKKLFEIMGQTPAVLNLAWHISPEIHSYLRHHGYRGQIVDILESSDVGDP